MSSETLARTTTIPTPGISAPAADRLTSEAVR